MATAWPVMFLTNSSQLQQSIERIEFFLEALDALDGGSNFSQEAREEGDSRSVIDFLLQLV